MGLLKPGVTGSSPVGRFDFNFIQKIVICVKSQTRAVALARLPNSRARGWSESKVSRGRSRGFRLSTPVISTEEIMLVNQTLSRDLSTCPRNVHGFEVGQTGVNAIGAFRYVVLDVICEVPGSTRFRGDNGDRPCARAIVVRGGKCECPYRRHEPIDRRGGV